MIEALLVDYLIGEEDPDSRKSILARIRLQDVFGYSSVLLEPQISSPLAGLTKSAISIGVATVLVGRGIV